MSVKRRKGLFGDCELTNFEPKNKPTKLREWIAWRLVKLAKKIYPDSKMVSSFYMGIMHDAMITGQAVVKIDPRKLYGDVN